VGALVIALAIHPLYPMVIAPGSIGILRIAGGIQIAIGLALSIAVTYTFRAAGTPVAPRRATTRLVSTGLYRYSRNPDYVGQTIAYTGASLIADSWWPIFLLPAVLALIQTGVIRREERYLEGKFSDAYRRYSAQVRRWL